MVGNDAGRKKKRKIRGKKVSPSNPHHRSPLRERKSGTPKTKIWELGGGHSPVRKSRVSPCHGGFVPNIPKCGTPPLGAILLGCVQKNQGKESRWEKKLAEIHWAPKRKIFGHGPEKNINHCQKCRQRPAVRTTRTLESAGLGGWPTQHEKKEEKEEFWGPHVKKKLPTNVERTRKRKQRNIPTLIQEDGKGGQTQKNFGSLSWGRG